MPICCQAAKFAARCGTEIFTKATKLSNPFSNMMQFIKTLLRHSIILCFPVTLFAQSTELPQGSKFERFLDRLTILLQDNPDLNLATTKYMPRKLAVKSAELADSLSKFFPYDDYYRLSPVDQKMLKDLLMNNNEWTRMPIDSFLSRKPLWNTFYKTKANFYEVHEPDFFLALNPVIQQTQSVESGNSERVFQNTKGFTLRGRIGQHLGFSTYLTDNQERGPSYFQEKATALNAVPGAGYYKFFKKTAFDYFDARGSIYFDAWKYFNFQFGYDKNFIGDGYRSLFLSDFAAPYLFLKINTRIWKLNYENIFMELTSQHTRGDYLYPKKYGVIHHLNFNAAKWLNIGLFENVMYSRSQYFDFAYLNPVIFLVSAQQQNGSPDKTTVGFDFKANVGHQTQVYGQLLLNEFVLKEIRHYANGWWGNKQGIQLGVKYIDAFSVKNLDLQLEGNIVRPFTYSHNDSVSNYSHYNQPMAHPLGANFDEILLIAHYQPALKWNAEFKVIYYRQGLDSGGINYGSNIFLNYDTRPRDYGFKVGSGLPSNCFLVYGGVSYEWKDNLFFDLSLQYRHFTVSDVIKTTENSTMVTLGVRMNMFKRQYDY